MKRTPFHKMLLELIVRHDVEGGLAGLCKMSGISYGTMQARVRNPRALRWYEYCYIVEALYLDKNEEAALQEAIKAG